MEAASNTEPPTIVQPKGSRRRKISKIILIVLTILWAVLLIPALMFALMSPFAFDSGATEEAFRVFYLLISFPFVLLFSTIIGWILYWFKRYILAVVFAMIPGLYFIYAVFLME